MTMTRSPSVLTSRSLTLGVLAAAALALAGCGSRVKLDDQASGPAPITSVSPTDGAGAGTGVASSNVAPVVVAPNANDAAASNIARVVYFDFDSFLVKEEFRPVIEAHARRMGTARDTRIVIEGHTDERGGREYNLALGQKRAEAVQRSLTLLGVPAERIEAVSFGEERPAANGSDESVWSQNRRAEIKDR